MKTFFNQDIEYFRTLSEKSFFLKHTLTTLFKSLNTPDLDSIFSLLKDILKSYPLITADFLDKYYDDLCYHIIMNLYDTAYKSLKQQNNDTVSMRDCIKAYLEKILGENCTGNSGSSVETTEPDISNRKKDFLLMSNIVALYPNAFSQQMYNFFDFWGYSIKEKSKKFNILCEKEDLILMLKNYPHCIYSADNYKTGIQIHSFAADVEAYINFNKSSDTFEKEYKTYVYEQLYRPIQFLTCVRTYYEQLQAEYHFSSDFHVFLYTKLFDTSYTFLSQYIIDKHRILKKDKMFSEHEELSCFIEFQLLNSFLLPCLCLLIKEYIWDIYKGNTEQIMETCKLYLEERLNQSSFSCNTFYNSFMNNSDYLQKARKYGHFTGYKN